MSGLEGGSEKIEGLEEEGSGWGEYPLDSVFVRNETRSVAEALRRIDGGRYILDPDFQREFVWNETKQSKLIESCLMRIPLPVFYLSEAKDGRIIVVDGLQRLSTFYNFYKGGLRLRGLAPSDGSDVKHPLEGKKFDDLPIHLQERVLDTQLITYILDAKAPERARLDIFERVNSGAPLTRQQMRNALYSGAATKWLKDAAESECFRAATGGSLDRLAMRDREAINRFCAFTIIGWQHYRSGDMDAFLAQALSRMNQLCTNDLTQLRIGFENSMSVNSTLFGEHAFRKSLAIASSDFYVKRNVLNIALWDVLSVLLGPIAARISASDQILEEVKSRLMRLVSDPNFSHAITYSTNSTRAVAKRFELASQILSELPS